MGLDAMIFVFWMLNFKPTFSLSSFTFIKRLFSSSSLSAIRVVTPNPSYDNPKCFQTLLNVPQGAKSPQIENQCAREKESLKKIGIHVSNNIFVVQLLSRVWLFATPWTTARQASLSINNSRNLLKLMSVESGMPSNHLILCRPLLLPPSVFPNIRVFSNESVLHIKWPKYWSFSFNIGSSSEHSGLISLRMDWLDLLAVQGTLKSPIQHHSSKASILRCSAFFIVQLSHPYMTTGKTITLTRWTFIAK